MSHCFFKFMVFTAIEDAEKETVLKLDEYAGRPTEKYCSATPTT